jgi:hypothetical protein
LPPLVLRAGIPFGAAKIIIAFSTVPFKRPEKSLPINGFVLAWAGLPHCGSGCIVALVLSLR